VAAVAPAQPARPAHRGVARSWAILSAMRREQLDPVRAYTLLGADTADLLAERIELAGARIIDVGGGPGYVAEALRARGAHACTVDAEVAELSLHGRTPRDAIVADGRVLPIADDALDAACTLNAIEHVADPWAFLAELVRVVRPGGTVFVGVTNWLSPWGGHETSPWHYLGGERAAQRYRSRHGVDPKNRFGSSLFPVRVADLLAWADRRDDVVLVDAYPRYYPTWCRPLVRVPGVREVATWNLAMVLEPR
jgi:SAM-dependent methyltransferase